MNFKQIGGDCEVPAGVVETTLDEERRARLGVTHSDNIKVEAGRMLIAWGNAFSRSFDLRTNLTMREDRWGAGEIARDYMTAGDRTIGSLLAALRIVAGFGAWCEKTATSHAWGDRPGFPSIAAMSLPVVSFASDHELVVTSGVLAWDDLLLRAGDRLLVGEDGSIQPVGSVEEIALGAATMQTFTYDTYAAGRELTPLESAALDVLDPGGEIRERMRVHDEAEQSDDADRSDDDWDDDQWHMVKYLAVQSILPVDLSGEPVLLAEVPTDVESIPRRWYDGFMVTLLDGQQRVGYVGVERGHGPMDVVNLYCEMFGVPAEEIRGTLPIGDAVVCLGTTVERLASSLRELEDREARMRAPESPGPQVGRARMTEVEEARRDASGGWRSSDFE